MIGFYGEMMRMVVLCLLDVPPLQMAPSHLLNMVEEVLHLLSLWLLVSEVGS